MHFQTPVQDENYSSMFKLPLAPKKGQNIPISDHDDESDADDEDDSPDEQSSATENEPNSENSDEVQSQGASGKDVQVQISNYELSNMFHYYKCCQWKKSFI